MPIPQIPFQSAVEFIFLLSLAYLFFVMLRFQIDPAKPFWNRTLIMGMLEILVGSVVAGYCLGLVLDNAASFSDLNGGSALLCAAFNPQIMLALFFFSAFGEYRSSGADQVVKMIENDPQVRIHAASVVRVYKASQFNSGNRRVPKGALVLTDSRLLCGDLEIRLNEIQQATIIPYKWLPVRSAVFRIETTDGELYYFGLRDYTPWTHQASLELVVAQPVLNIRVLAPYLIIGGFLLYMFVNTVSSIL